MRCPRFHGTVTIHNTENLFHEKFSPAFFRKARWQLPYFVCVSKSHPFFFDGVAAKEEHICFANENGV